MGAERVVAMGAWASLGWILDAQRALARADRAMARAWVFHPEVESTRSALLWFNRAVLDWPPVIEHVSRLLHRSVSAASTSTADPVCRAPNSRDSSIVRCISPARFGVAMDPRGAAHWSGDCRLCLRHISFRGAAFRCSFTLSRARRARPVHSD